MGKIGRAFLVEVPLDEARDEYIYQPYYSYCSSYRISYLLGYVH